MADITADDTQATETDEAAAPKLSDMTTAALVELSRAILDELADRLSEPDDEEDNEREEKPAPKTASPAKKTSAPAKKPSSGGWADVLKG